MHEAGSRLDVCSESYAQLLAEGSLTCKYATQFNLITDVDFTETLASVCHSAHLTGNGTVLIGHYF